MDNIINDLLKNNNYEKYNHKIFYELREHIGMIEYEKKEFTSSELLELNDKIFKIIDKPTKDNWNIYWVYMERNNETFEEYISTKNEELIPYKNISDKLYDGLEEAQKEINIGCDEWRYIAFLAKQLLKKLVPVYYPNKQINSWGDIEEYWEDFWKEFDIYLEK